MAAIRLVQGQGRSLSRLSAEACKVGGVAFVQHRDGSQLAAYKRGKGGRSSFSGIVATVFGSSGFFGRYIVNRLGKIGSQVVLPYRCDPYWMKHLKVAGDLGQILFVPANLYDEESLRKSMKYSNVVINLIGRDWETKNYKYKDVHVTGAQTIARIAREEGVEKLIHFSAMNASPNPSPIYMSEGSNFLKSKWLGEMKVREEFPDAIIFRPGATYGPEDRFIRYYANAWRRHHNMIPLYKKGEATVKMPVFVSDIAEGVINAIYEKDNGGTTYECVGPKSYLLSELVDYFYRCMRYENMKRVWVNPVFRAKMMVQSQMPNTPILHKEKLEFEHVSDVLTGQATLEDLGVKLTPIEDRANYELVPYRFHNYYLAAVGEFADPDPPQALATL